MIERAKFWIRKNAYILFSGSGLSVVLLWARPGNGKTLDTARQAFFWFRSYRKMDEFFPNLPKRTLWSNMKFSKKIEDDPVYGLGKRLFYWEDPEDLKKLRNVDIIWDDIAIYIPADEWDKVDPGIRKMLIMYRHRGLRIYATCQDYKMVAVQFRRVVKFAYKMNKWFGSRDISATLPDPRTIWGLVTKRRFDPDEIEGQGKTVTDSGKIKEMGSVVSFIPSDWFWITRELCEAYNTTEELSYEGSGMLICDIYKAPCGFVKHEHRKRI